MDSLVTVAVPTNPGKRLSYLPLTSDSPIPIPPSIQSNFYEINFFRVSSPSPIIETTGYIAEDREGDIGVITGLHLIDKAVYIDKERFLFVYNNKNQGFRVKKVKHISPENNMVFLIVEGDLTEGGKRPPLPLANSYSENEPLFYTLRATSPKGLWFKTKPVQKRISVNNSREDFLITDLYSNTALSAEVIGEPVVNQTPILNQKGEVVSFASNGSGHAMYGVPLQDLSHFLNSSEICSVFIRGCAMRAKRSLHEQAQFGNRKAMYMLLLFANESFLAFEELMRFIGENDSIQIKRDYENFWEESIEWDPELYYRRAISDGDISEEERRKQLQFLEQKSAAKFLAEQGHPHFQYVLGNIYFYLGDKHQAEYWISKSAENGYIPSRLIKMDWLLANSLNKLIVLAEQNYAPAKKFLFLISHDFEEAEKFLANHNKMIPHFPKLEEDSGGFFQRIKNRLQGDMAPAVRETAIFELNVTFSKSMNYMTQGFELLNQMAEQGYTPAKRLQDRLKQHIAQKELKLPNHPLSEQQERECEETYTAHFVPAPID